MCAGERLELPASLALLPYGSCFQVAYRPPMDSWTRIPYGKMKYRALSKQKKGTPAHAHTR